MTKNFNFCFSDLFVPVCRNETEDLDKQDYPIRKHVTFLPTQFPTDFFLMGKKLNGPNDHHLDQIILILSNAAGIVAAGVSCQ